MHPLLSYASDKQNEIVAFIRELVRCESPSDDPAAVNRFCELLADHTRDIAEPQLFPAAGFGSHLRLDFKVPGRKRNGRILGLGHADTVWPVGTLTHMPFREEGGRLWGPGVLDMKAGLAFLIFAARGCRDCDIAVHREVSLLVVSDEEVGSSSSRELTEAEAKKSTAVLVLEPGTGLEGRLKTQRKGIGGYTIRVEGRASHAGVDFAAGANAIVELARQIDTITKFTNLRRGITVNPGTIRGGTRTNVVPAEAEAAIDLRIAKLADAPGLDQKFRALRPFDKRCKLTITGGMNRPPMERSKQGAKLFKKAAELGKKLGVKVDQSATGGGSDGNFTAALGIPTLDGLGAVGEGAHASNESILVNRIADRTALLSLLISQL
jgi:glutamate carboxypeptidase